MLFYPTKTVNVKQLKSGIPIPTIVIEIVVDVAYIVGQQGQTISKGIYMMDNMVNNGSTNEGTMDLKTVGNLGALVGWHVTPTDDNAVAMGQSVIIQGFQVCSGNVFGQAGFPEQQGGSGNYWIGQLMYSGSQTYQIQLEITAGALRPVSYYINWEASISA